jgi:hypothetical protein
MRTSSLLVSRLVVRRITAYLDDICKEVGDEINVDSPKHQSQDTSAKIRFFPRWRMGMRHAVPDPANAAAVATARTSTCSAVV